MATQGQGSVLFTKLPAQNNGEGGGARKINRMQPLHLRAGKLRYAFLFLGLDML